jgi:hypothetical protein
MKYYITVKQLERGQACEQDVALFRRLFHSRMLVSIENALLFNRARGDASTAPWSWAARNLLVQSQSRVKYCRSTDRYFDAYSDSVRFPSCDRDLNKKRWGEVVRKCARRFIVLYLKERGRKSA